MKDALEFSKEYLESKKVDSYEIYGLERDHFSADSRMQKIESLEKACEQGLAFRVINEERLGFSYTSQLNKNNIRNAINSAIAGSRFVRVDKYWKFPEVKTVDDFDWDHTSKSLNALTDKEKTEMAVYLESITLEYDKRIKRVRRSTFEEAKLKNWLVNSNGVNLNFSKHLIACEIMAIAENDIDSQYGCASDFAYDLKDLDLQSVAKRAAMQAVDLLGATSIETKKMPICLHPDVGTQFLKILANAFYGDNIYKKKSALIGKMDEKMYSEKLTITDNGLLPYGFDSSPYDAEGSPRTKINLVEGGIVSNWLTNLYWGSKLNIGSSGSCSRRGVKEIPSIGISNLYIEPGELSQAELLRDMNNGFFITDVAGIHTANLINGDFSVGAEGKLVENGNFGRPVKGVMISGNIHDIFKKVVNLGKDMQFFENVGAPTILISDLQISGK